MVASVDHAGTLPFGNDATGEPLSTMQLEVRTADVIVALDAALSGALFSDSLVLSNVTVDEDRIGAFGHSFGSVTVAQIAGADDRIRAVAGLAAPMENPLLPGVTMGDIEVPVFMLLAKEDNSILEFGNQFIRSNFESANTPIWLISVDDAGHWSISDICGLTEAFEAGCGDGVRHSEGAAGEPFEYLPPALGIAITQYYLTSFLVTQLNSSADSGWTVPPAVFDGVTVRSRLE